MAGTRIADSETDEKGRVSVGLDQHMKCCKLGSLNTDDVSHSPGGRKSKIRVSIK